MIKAGLKKLALAAGFATCALGVAAPSIAGNAEGVVTIESIIEPPASRFTWEGMYAGAQVNWFNFLQGASGRSLSGANGAGTALNAGVHFGVRGDAGPFIIGLELDANAIPFRLQNGQTVDGHVLAKAKFGVEFGRLLATASFGPGAYFGTGIDAAGLVYGGGVDYMINDKFTVGVEYLNHKMSGWGAPSAFVPDPRAEGSTISLRAGYRF